MKSGIVLAAALGLAACLGEPEESVRVARWRDLIVESRSLPADNAFAEVGLRPSADRDDGATEWFTSFREAEGATEGEFVRRDYRITIGNRGSTAREFHARIDYLGAEGKILRRILLDELVVPPFTESTWIGGTMIRREGEIAVLARVLPASEPFDPDEG
ncbi:MAG TPA: hypothetical protein VMS56_14820 [Thermoanaerobaculia bacterium]|nr:hypothetical protein [Thermoanaerobaculia bacterium]